ncbi:MAG: PDZ domain-containing protein [Phycisphaeraceae bacterium]|nr:PDZ domain-containing protein [Phycisphaeraceae bacterium]
MDQGAWKMGVIGTAAAALVGWAGVDRAAAQPSAAPPTGRAVVDVRIAEVESGPDNGVWVFKSNGEDIRIESRDGTITKAERNGKEIPVDRVSRAGGGITIVDENGKVIFEMSAPPAPPTPPSAPAAIRVRPQVQAWRLGPGGANSLPGGADVWLGSAPAPAEPPAVMLGITMADPEYGLQRHCGVDAKSGGTMVNEVYKDLPAAKAGIHAYDVIVEVDGKSPATQDVVREMLRSKKPGDEIAVTVLHKCEPKAVTITLEAYDPKRLEAARQEQMRAAGVPLPSALGIGEDETVARSPLFALKGLSGDRLMQFDPAGNEEMVRRIQEQVLQALQRSGLNQETMKQLTERIQTTAPATRLAEVELKQVQERLARLEALLERMADQQDKAGQD